MAEAVEANKKVEAPLAAGAAPDYGTRLSNVIQWMLAALGAVAATALGKIVFDQLRDGDYGNFRWLLTFLAAISFGVGVVALLSAAVATTTESAVGFSWLKNATEPTGGKAVWRWINQTLIGRDPYLAWEVVSALADSRYLTPIFRASSELEVMLTG